MSHALARSVTVGMFATAAIIGAALGASGAASATPPPPPCPGDSPWSLAEPPPPVRIDLSVICPSPAGNIPPTNFNPKYLPQNQIPGGGILFIP